MKQPSTVVLVGLIVSILAIIFVTASQELSQRETLFLTVLLTAVAIAASWLATHLYSQQNINRLREALREEHRENLRTYALNATEKVQNLSSEMERLVDYLTQSSETFDEPIDAQLLLERVRAARLSLRMLKSMNDTAVSDWRGVIGDDLARQAQVESSMEELYEKLESLVPQVTLPDEQLIDLPARLDEIRAGIEKQARLLAANSPIKVRPPKKVKERTTVDCPTCDAPNATRVVYRRNWQKGQECARCGSFFSVGVDSDLEITVNALMSETTSFECEICANEFKITYPPDATQFAWQVECPRCTAKYAANVHKGHLVANPAHGCSKDFLDKLEHFLEGKEAQPPDARTIAKTLSMPQPAVNSGLSVLNRLRQLREREQDAGQQGDRPASTA